MSLIAVFAVLVVIGQAINAAISMQVDNYSETAGLPVFFVLLVAVIIVAWKLAVRLTEPRGEGERAKEKVGGAA
jgi:membrane protein implicated in regulation of membrane protease activity